MGGRLNACCKREISNEEQQHQQLINDLDEAYVAWQIAMQNFNQASNPESVDDAIYLLLAAEKRYEGLLRVVRRERLTVPIVVEVDAEARYSWKEM